MSHIRRCGHVGITVADLDTVTVFFVGLGLKVEGRTFVESEFVDTVIGISGSRGHIVTLRPPDRGPGMELSSFVQPWGCATFDSKSNDLQATVDRLVADGYGLVGGIGQYEHIWRMA